MLYLTLQATYTRIEYALCTNDHTLLTASDDKLYASKNILLTIQRLLDDKQATLSDLQFIAVNRGPGPFTTLRTVIATINGIAFASGIPLVAVHGLEALVQEWQSETYPQVIALLNAFGQDVYFGSTLNSTVEIGCSNYQTILKELHTKTNSQSVLFVGNGAAMYRNTIKEIFGNSAQFPNPLPSTVSITYLAHCASKQWKAQQNVVKQIEPLYLKIQY